MALDEAERSYARAIEKEWSRLHGHAPIFSSRDWSLVRSWFRSRVPIEWIREALEESNRRRAGEAPRDLAALRSFIEETGMARSDRRTERSTGEDPPAIDDRQARRAWRRAAESHGTGSEFGRRLLELVDRAASEDDPLGLARIDDELDRILPLIAPRELLEAATRERDRSLASSESRMDPATLARTRAEALARRLRRALHLPRLTDPVWTPEEPRK